MSSQGIIIVSQLLLPPLFLRRYGIVTYAEWLTLSAAAQYLGTLNFGLHNFANNHATIAYNRGEIDEVNVVQATAFSLVLALAGIVAALACLLFLLPVSPWLHLTIASRDAAAAIYLLGLQVLVRLIFGFLTNSFLVVGSFHRGSNWYNALSLATLVSTVTLILFHASLVRIAAGQMLTAVLIAVLAGIDLHSNASVAFPRLQYASRSRVMGILRPSGYFGMLFSASFLVYQLPVVIMQRMLGPVNVVVFSITRTIYSMSRQSLTAISTAIGPEITELYGKGNWKGLLNLYDLSERVVFALVPVVTLATLVATPSLLAIWMHKPELFQPDVCVFMALISAAAGIKEHKYQFQISINHHTEMARFLFLTYLFMIAASIPSIFWFGIRGFLFLWLVTETAQIIYTVKLNGRLFNHVAALSLSPLYRIGIIMVLGITACWAISRAIQGQPVLWQFAIATLFALGLLAIEYPIFGLAEIRSYLISRSARATQKEELTPAA